MFLACRLRPASKGIGRKITITGLFVTALLSSGSSFAQSFGTSGYGYGPGWPGGGHGGWSGGGASWEYPSWPTPAHCGCPPGDGDDDEEPQPGDDGGYPTPGNPDPDPGTPETPQPGDDGGYPAPGNPNPDPGTPGTPQPPAGTPHAGQQASDVRDLLTGTLDGPRSPTEYPRSEPDSSGPATTGALYPPVPGGGQPAQISAPPAAKPANYWVRAKGNLLGGNLGLSGRSGIVEAGVTVDLTPTLDFGYYVHFLAGSVTSSTLGASLDSLGGGVGIYSRYRPTDHVELGLLTGMDWAGNTIAMGGTTGTFASSKWTVAASVGAPFDVNGMTVTPMLIGTYKQLHNDGYVNSGGLAVPASFASTIVVSPAVELARTYERGSGRVKSVTPIISVQGNFYVQRASALNPTTALRLEGNAFTLDANAGVQFNLSSGGKLDLSLGSEGFFGTSQAYKVRVGLRIPLN